MKYRKKPVIIEAVQWNGDNFDELVKFTNGRWLDYDNKNGLFVWTLEGRMHASVGDFLIKGVSGEFYACKPDIFHQTYEEVKEDK